MEISTRIVAVEPDPQRAEVLSRILDKRVGTSVTIVQDVDAALTSIAEHVPDVILTSTFLPPDALARLIDELRRCPDASHTQVITTPLFFDVPDEGTGDGSDRVLRFPRQRTNMGLFHCDPATLRTHVAEYLDHAIALREAARNRPQAAALTSSLLPVPRLLDPWQSTSGSSSVKIPTAQELRALSLRPADRRRASRRRAADLGGQWALRLTPQGDASILDISSSGIRLETNTRLQSGNVINFELIGMEGSVPVSARLIRAETVESDGSDGFEVKYRAAAKFLREIDLFSTKGNAMVAAAVADSLTPKALGDLLGRVLANAAWVSNGSTLRSRFETELRGLVGAKEVSIRTVPVRAAGGCQSLCFKIPSTSDSEYALHVVFERGHRPSAAEFRLLKAAASVAAIVVDLDPVGEPPSIN
jgi:hypothetical protein